MIPNGSGNFVERKGKERKSIYVALFWPRWYTQSRGRKSRRQLANQVQLENGTLNGCFVAFCHWQPSAQSVWVMFTNLLHIIWATVLNLQLWPASNNLTYAVQFIHHFAKSFSQLPTNDHIISTYTASKNAHGLTCCNLAKLTDLQNLFHCQKEYEVCYKSHITLSTTP